MSQETMRAEGWRRLAGVVAAAAGVAVLVTALRRRRARQLCNGDDDNDDDDEQQQQQQQQQRVLDLFSRQMLFAPVGPAGQRRLSEAHVLVVGAGGIAATLLPYLAGAGVGCISVVDGDHVELSNLHRQVLHRHEDVGRPKALSACDALRRLRPQTDMLTLHARQCRLTAENVLGLLRPAPAAGVAEVTLCVDATDNFATKYLLNDVCSMLGIVLVSGSAIGGEGQVAVYHPERACLRCLFPRPPATVAGGERSCSDFGVLGPMPGLIGCLQALEAIKVITAAGTPLSDRQLYFNALDAEMHEFRRGAKRRKDCLLCSGAIASVQDSARWIEETFGGTPSCAATSSSSLPPDARITCFEFSAHRAAAAAAADTYEYLLLDVRAPHQYEMSHLPEAVNVPWGDSDEAVHALVKATANHPMVFCMCRRGVLSQLATQALLQAGVKNVRNVEGGLSAWKRDVDTEFPMY